MYKQILPLLLLLISIGKLNAQNIRHEFESYALRDVKYTGNRAAIINQPFKVLKKAENEFILDIKIADGTFCQLQVYYMESFDFADQTIFRYEGAGNQSWTKINVELETKINLNDVVNGKGYDEKVDYGVLDDYEIHIFYWLPDTDQPTVNSNNFYIYPIKNKSSEQKALEEQRHQKKKQLLFGYTNIADKDSTYVSRLLPKLEEHILQLAKDDLEKSYVFGESKKWDSLAATYKVRYYSKADSKISQCKVERITSNIAYTPKYFGDINVRLPKFTETFESREYSLNTEIFVNFQFDLIRDRIEVKHKPNKPIEILSDSQLTQDQISQIESTLTDEKRGNYEVLYQFGTINGKEATEILFRKI